MLASSESVYGQAVHGTGLASGAPHACEPRAVYRPRHPERSAFYQILERHFDDYVHAYEERFERRSGPLRPVVARCVYGLLDCGRLQGGFARLRCPSCEGEHLLAFSCQTRNFCSSCQAKRSALFAERLVEEILEPVPHRHFVFTIPRALRGLFERDRNLLGLLSRTAYDAVRLSFQALFASDQLRPGVVASIQTFGSFAANFHPHIHMLVTDGVFDSKGAFLGLPSLDTSAIEELFRRLLLTRLNRAERLSHEFMLKLFAWSPSGFSVNAAQLVMPHERQRLERLARYLTRPPVSMASVHLAPDGSVIVDTPPDPRSGQSVKRLDVLDWIHAITSQIPDPHSHLTRYYGRYANRVRGAGGEPPAPGEPSDESPFSKARRASWARLLKRVFEVEAMLCPRCGVEMAVISVITEHDVIDQIVRHLGNGGGDDPFDPRGPPEDHLAGHPATLN